MKSDKQMRYFPVLQSKQADAAAEGSRAKKPQDGRQNQGQEKPDSVKGWKQNRPAKLKFTYKEQKEFETIDEVIAELEQKIEKLDAQILENATNSARLSELMKEKDQAEEELEEKMERWLYLNELQEQIQLR